MNKPIKFDSIPWDNSTEGVAQKVFINGNETVRLVKFSDTFVEKDWCTKNHLGYVLKGQLKLNFEDEIVVFEERDSLILNSGRKHKIIMDPGTTVELILFESIK